MSPDARTHSPPVVNSIFGLRVFLSPDRPRYVLPPDVPPPTGMTRREFDAWARVTCGTVNDLSDGEMLCTAQAVHVNPRTFAHLKVVLP